MSSSEVTALLGKPTQINVVYADAAGVKQQYIYTEASFQTPGQTFVSGFQQGVSGQNNTPHYLCLYFVNDKFTSLQAF